MIGESSVYYFTGFYNNLLHLPVDLMVVFREPRVAKYHFMLPKVCNSKDGMFRVVSESEDDVNNVPNGSSFIWCTIHIVYWGRT